MFFEPMIPPKGNDDFKVMWLTLSAISELNGTVMWQCRPLHASKSSRYRILIAFDEQTQSTMMTIEGHEPNAISDSICMQRLLAMDFEKSLYNS